jgi:hypothetical protein
MSKTETSASGSVARPPGRGGGQPLLLFWNLSAVALNVMAGAKEPSIGGGFILPLFAAIIFFKQYLKLHHLKKDISAMDHSTVKEAAGLCRQLFKSKLKESPDIAEASSRRCRMRFMSDAVFCAQRNLARAFYMNRANFQGCIPDLNRKKLRVVGAPSSGQTHLRVRQKEFGKNQGLAQRARDTNELRRIRGCVMGEARTLSFVNQRAYD